MKRKVVKVTRKSTSPNGGLNFDSTEFLLLVFVTLILLSYFGIKMGLVPKFFTDSVLGVATSR